MQKYINKSKDKKVETGTCLVSTNDSILPKYTNLLACTDNYEL